MPNHIQENIDQKFTTSTQGKKDIPWLVILLVNLCVKEGKVKDHADQARLENMGTEGPAEKTSKLGLNELVA